MRNNGNRNRYFPIACKCFSFDTRHTTTVYCETITIKNYYFINLFVIDVVVINPEF